MENNWLKLNVVPNPEFVYANWDIEKKDFTSEARKILEQRHQLLSNVFQLLKNDYPDLILDLEVNWYMEHDHSTIAKIDCNNPLAKVQICEFIKKVYNGSLMLN